MSQPRRDISRTFDKDARDWASRLAYVQKIIGLSNEDPHMDLIKFLEDKKEEEINAFKQQCEQCEQHSIALGATEERTRLDQMGATKKPSELIHTFLAMQLRCLDATAQAEAASSCTTIVERNLETNSSPLETEYREKIQWEKTRYWELVNAHIALLKDLAAEKQHYKSQFAGLYDEIERLIRDLGA